ncbi:MAG: RluA family pseudouridine synthase [Caulobacterales bacterium]
MTKKSGPKYSPIYTQGNPRRRQRDWSVEAKPFPITQEDADFVRSLLIYEDQHILAFDKPSGISAQAGKEGIKTLDRLLTAFAKSNGKRPQLVHRIDRETSGIIIAARNYPAAGFLGKAFAERRTAKTYLALACGDNLPDAGEFSTPLKKWRDPRGFDAMKAGERDDPESETAQTRFRTLAQGPGWRMLHLEPVTGRMHQIRAHLALAGAPIAADHKYGGLNLIGSVSVPRLMLHAYSIEIPHPAGGKMTLRAPMTDDFRGVLSKLGAGSALEDY